jgi:TonB family protein
MTALDRLTHSLIVRSARSAPESLSDRLQEEWLADLAVQHGAFARLRFALGCCWARRVIAHEFLSSQGAAVASAGSAGQQSMAAFAPHNSNFLSQRTAIFVLIVGLHGVLIYSFANGFVVKVFKEIPAITVIFDPPKVIPDPTPPLPAQSKPTIHHRTQVDIPPIPPIDLTDPPPRSTVITETTVHEGPVPEVLPPPIPVRQVGGPGKGFPDTRDYYPSSAIRAGQRGAATVRVCVGPNGQLESEPTIVQSSGIASLDDGALKLARAGSGHYRATTEDGRPVGDCYAYRIRFQIDP